MTTNTLTSAEWEALRQQLLAPLHPSLIKWLEKPGRSGAGTLHLAYLDEAIIRRILDEKVGPGNWEFDLQPVDVGDGCAFIGRLTVYGITRADVGEWSRDATNKDTGKGMTDLRKAAATDAFKRAAQRFWIGNFLEYLPRRGQLAQGDIEKACRTAGWNPGRATPPAGAGADASPREPEQAPAHEAAGTGGAAVTCSACPTELTPQQARASQGAFQQLLCPKCQQKHAAQLHREGAGTTRPSIGAAGGRRTQPTDRPN